MNTKIIVSVFNQAGNFAGNVDLVENASVQDVVDALIPHRVTESANPDTKIISVKPMHGLEVNESGFFSMIKTMLQNNGLVEEDTVFQTGYGDLTVTASTVINEDEISSSIVINHGTEILATVNSSVAVGRHATMQDAILEARRETMNKVTGMVALLQQAGEWAYESLYREEAKGIHAPEEENPIADIKKDEVAIPAAEPRRLRNHTPPALQRPTVASPESMLAQERARVRNVVDKEVRQLQPGSQLSARNQVQDAPIDSPELCFIDILPADRDTQLRVAIELFAADADRFFDEGVLSTVLAAFPGSAIDNQQLTIPTGKGYLVTLRQALSDHGIEPISVTPRSVAAWSSDIEEGVEPINLINR